MKTTIHLFKTIWFITQHVEMSAPDLTHAGGLFSTSGSEAIDCKTSFRRIKLMLVFQHDSPYTVIQRIQVSEVWNFFVSITRCELLTISYILLMLTKRKIRELTGFTCILIASRSIKIS